MSVEKFIKKRSKWLEGSGPFSNIAISSRVRLARNIADFPFPYKASKEELKNIIKITASAIKTKPLLRKTTFIKLNKLSLIDRQFLVERHLISAEHTLDGEKAVAIDSKEQVSIMINEEDHIRIQVMNSGLQLVETFELADSVDDELSSVLNFAYSNSFGYLTACPTNTGTGIRASVMLHLPALVFDKKLDKIFKGVSHLGLTIRGLYGENSNVKSAFFQVSNQISMGKYEEEIIDDVDRIVRQIIDYEQQSRVSILNKSRVQIEDKVWRAFAILSNARIISYNEVLDCLSVIRLGVEMNIIKGIKIGVLNELLVLSQPAHIQKILGMEMDAKVRDIKRAELIRGKLKSCYNKKNNI